MIASLSTSTGPLSALLSESESELESELGHFRSIFYYCSLFALSLLQINMSDLPVTVPPQESIPLPVPVSAMNGTPSEHEHEPPTAMASVPVSVQAATTGAAAPLSVPDPVASGIQVVLPLEEFAEDLDLRLGRANGNIYQRKQGIEGLHDGQVMVRLKKKRFIVMDYGIVPNEQDIQAAAMHPNISVPLGAGVTKCTGKVASEPGGPLVQCKKVGVPVLLYDSEPEEAPSLYLRSGLCFVCQRNLNEKRRTQRKRPSDRANQAAKVTANAQHSQAAFLTASHMSPMASNANLPGMQTVRIGGIGNQANLVGAGTTGRVNATPHHRVLMAVTNGHKKIKLAHTNQPLVLAPDAIILNGPPDNHSCKSVRAGHGFAEIGTDLNVEVHQSLQSTQTLLHSVNAPEIIQQGIPPPTPDEISRTYDQAFYSLSKSLYLLVQWKTSWDAAVASAMQQEPHIAQPPSSVVMGSTLPNTPTQQGMVQHAAALQAASMANAAATAAIGGMINGVPGSVPVGIPGVGVLPEPTNLAQAVASAAAVAAVSQPKPDKETTKQEVLGSPPTLDQSVEV